MDALHLILAYYGMPEENIESAITQIAQGYGASRYLEGVKSGAEAVSEPEKKDGVRFICCGKYSSAVKDSIVYYTIPEDDRKCVMIWLQGGFTINNHYSSEEEAVKQYKNLDALMKK
jgi:hypothetical protein